MSVLLLIFIQIIEYVYRVIKGSDSSIYGTGSNNHYIHDRLEVTTETEYNYPEVFKNRNYMVTKRNFMYDSNPGEETLINYSTSLCKMRNLSKFWAWMIYWPDRKSYHHLKVNVCVLSACDNAKLNYKSPYIPVQKITKKV